MARAIDGEELLGIERLLDTDVVRKNETASWLLDQVLHDIQAMPTLTPPNEGAKGKNVPTSGPLTLEELSLMIEPTPVWWDQINSWVLVYKGNLTTWSGKHLYAKGSNGKFYRRPPEGEANG